MHFGLLPPGFLFLYLYIEIVVGEPLIVLKKQPNEIWREGSKIVVDYDNERIHITSVGNFDVPHALRCKEFIFEIFDNSDTFFDLIIDITHEGSHAPGTRRVWKEINRHPKVRHVALVGVNSFAKVVHTFIIGFRKHPKLRLFTKKDEALDWIQKLVSTVQTWFDSNTGKLPEHKQEVLIYVDNVHYFGKFDASKKLFRVENELRETIFSVNSHQVFWTIPPRPRSGKIDSFHF